MRWPWTGWNWPSGTTPAIDAADGPGAGAVAWAQEGRRRGVQPHAARLQPGALDEAAALQHAVEHLDEGAGPAGGGQPAVDGENAQRRIEDEVLDGRQHAAGIDRHMAAPDVGAAHPIGSASLPGPIRMVPALVIRPRLDNCAHGHRAGQADVDGVWIQRQVVEGDRHAAWGAADVGVARAGRPMRLPTTLLSADSAPALSRLKLARLAGR